MNKHVIFYDGDCPLCNRVVRFLLKKDKQKLFLFSPLSGSTAKKELHELRKKDPDMDTLVFLENYQTPHQKQLIRARASLRILWILGGKYRLIGWLSFLPPFLFDLAYRFIARHRYKLFNGHFQKVSPQELEGRLLP